jgi:hypothetical protein
MNLTAENAPKYKPPISRLVHTKARIPPENEKPFCREKYLTFNLFGRIFDEIDNKFMEAKSWLDIVESS